MSNENETNKPQASPEEEAPKKEVKAEAKSPAEDAEKKKAPPKAKAAPAAEKKEEDPPPPLELGEVGQLLKSNGFSPEASEPDAGGVETVCLKPAELLKGCEFLRDDEQCKYDLLACLSGVDWKEYRQVTYHLYATATNKWVVVKANAVDDKLPSVVPVWQGADWHEREAYDLFGITFEGHPDLRRILMPADWIGHPMLKDYVLDDPRLVWNER